MKKIVSLVCALVISASAGTAFAQDAKLTGRLSNATNVLTQIMATPDRGIPQSILAGASCVVVVPKYKKAALGIGG